MMTSGTDSKKLMQEFPPADPAEWRKLVDSQLNGAPFEKKLVTTTPEGIAVQPIYSRENVQPLASGNAMPGEFPYLRGVKASGARTTAWEVAQEIPVGTPEAFNEALLADLARGQTAVVLKLDRAGRKGQDADTADDADLGRDGTSISSLQDLETALKDVDLTAIPLYIEAGLSAPVIAGMLAASSHAAGEKLQSLSGNLGMDPVGQIAGSGILPADPDAVHKDMGDLAKWCRSECPGLRPLMVDVSLYGNAGAHAVQELAFMLGTGVVYMRVLLEQGLSADEAAASIGVTMGIGPDFFTEVSKFRAARVLWANMLKAFGVSEDQAGLDLHLTTLDWNKTVHDPYVNMLRSTTEAFAAGLGGCRSMKVKAFDSLSGEPDRFSRRIARNQQIVLAEETHLTDVVDPAGGSWYVENLTRDLSTSAWKLFQDIEGLGGMGAALGKGKIQEWIASSLAARQQNLARRKTVMVGTNMYANLEEEALPIRKVDAAAVRARSRGERTAQADESVASIRSGSSIIDGLKTAAENGAAVSELCRAVYGESQGGTIEPVNQVRLTEGYEKLREATRRFAASNGGVPKAFMANMGPVPQYKARSDFSAEFLKPSGFTILNDASFGTAEEAARAAADSGASLTVICSTDDTYPELVPVFAKEVKKLKPDIMVMVAGMLPDHEAAFREAGVDEFIHLRANNLDLLKTILTKTGVQS